MKGRGNPSAVDEKPFTGILADWQIDKLARRGMITPYHDRKVSFTNEEPCLSFGLEPFGYTLRLNSKYLRPMHTGETTYAGATSQEWLQEEPTKKHGKEWVVVPQSGFVLASSIEHIALPDNVQAQCLTKSTIAREGGFANITWLDAGWSGYLTIEIANLGSNALALPVGEGVCQLVFHQGLAPNKAYRGRYQNQGRLPQVAK